MDKQGNSSLLEGANFLIYKKHWNMEYQIMTELDLKAAIQKVSSCIIKKISRAKRILYLPSWQIRGSFQWDFIFFNVCYIYI